MGPVWLYNLSPSLDDDDDDFNGKISLMIMMKVKAKRKKCYDDFDKWIKQWRTSNDFGSKSSEQMDALILNSLEVSFRNTVGLFFVSNPCCCCCCCCWVFFLCVENLCTSWDVALGWFSNRCACRSSGDNTNVQIYKYIIAKIHKHTNRKYTKTIQKLPDGLKPVWLSQLERQPDSFLCHH